MKVSRDLSAKIRLLMDEYIPPVIRDSKWFMFILFRFLYKDKADLFKEFKSKAYSLSEKEYAQVYKEVDLVMFERESDLNKKSLAEIQRKISGKTILDVGCGKGYLAKILSKKYKVTACDVNIDSQLVSANPKVKFIEANIENLPFSDKQFDIVTCTHAIEHIRDLSAAIKELRRVAKKRLIIVTPMQRPYKYTFDLHLHFFPYPHSLLALMGKQKRNFCRELDGDLFYYEDK